MRPSSKALWIIFPGEVERLHNIFNTLNGGTILRQPEKILKIHCDIKILILHLRKV